jgi:hypothetical protein
LNFLLAKLTNIGQGMMKDVISFGALSKGILKIMSLLAFTKYGAHDQKKDDDANAHNDQNLRRDLIDGVHYFFFCLLISW